MQELDVALDITSAFEGGGFNNLTGSFDGMGISAGILQWNYGQGSLQVLLKKYVERYGEPFGFPVPIGGSSTMSPADAVKFATQMQDAEHHIPPPWKNPWKALLSSPEFIEIQKTFCMPSGEHAGSLRSIWKCKSLAAYCLFFDVVVQNGGMRGLVPSYLVEDVAFQAILAAAEATNRGIWETMPPSLEQLRLSTALWQRAATVLPQYHNDFLARKMTIIMQRGWAHGKYFDLQEILSQDVTAP